MVLLSRGDFVWLGSTEPDHCALGARVVDFDTANDRLKLVDDDGQERWVDDLRRVWPMHPSSVQGVEDMIQLGDLHDPAVLRNVCSRYRRKLIYTYTGSILIAVNPYMELPIYAAQQMHLYRGRRLGDLPPHLFAIADAAYTNMRSRRVHQCLLISGESGAGKTQSTKLVLQFLAAASAQHSWIEQQVLEANPILEAFGNARTTRNDNSSRFGKYVDVRFDANGAIQGASILHYLLEKSRLVSQAKDERNYHIFYCMLAGLSAHEKQELALGKAEDYFYLTQGGVIDADGRDDAADFAEVRSAMKVLLFRQPEISAIFRILAALLHIGNIKYRVVMDDNTETVQLAEQAELRAVAQLLQVDLSVLSEALVRRTLVTREERVQTALSPRQALDMRDALVKSVYGRLFLHIVQRINHAIHTSSVAASSLTSIGVLDIFGFENIPSNSFEQLCINFANEQLQQFFVRHIFKQEQADYDQENINWSTISFVDNQETLDVLAYSPMNIFSLVDEEAIFPSGTDRSLLAKLHRQWAARSDLYLRPRSDLQRAFGVRHFAGDVFYDISGFLEKNRDTFSSHLMELLAASKFKFLTKLFDESEYSDFSSMRRKTGGATVGSQFRRSLDALMSQLRGCEPFFIRCIKPNDEKRSLTIDRWLVLRQLRYSGMMDAIRIRRQGYPIRHVFQDFVDRYRVAVNGVGASKKVDCRRATELICRMVLGAQTDWQLGSMRVFLKEAQQLELERARERALHRRALVIQSAVRGYCARRKFVEQRAAAVIIQSAWRGFVQRRRYKRIMAGVARLQAVIRTRQLVNRYQLLRYIVVQFQARCRGALVRADFAKRRALVAVAASHQDSVAQLKRTLIPDGPTVPLKPPHDDILDLPTTPIDQRTYATLASATGCRDDDSANSTMSKSTSSEEQPPADPFGDVTAFHFAKFAATYFQGQTSGSFERRVLRQPLTLTTTDPTLQLAAMASWVTILRFMGDLPDVSANEEKESSTYDKLPVMSSLSSRLARPHSQRDVERTVAQYQTQFHSDRSRPQQQQQPMAKRWTHTLRKAVSRSASRVSDSSESRRSSNKSDNRDEAATTGPLLEHRRMSALDKVHFICGLAILRLELRDEIYAQICKQLTQNPSRQSTYRGWLLLSLCVGCFAPSPRLVRYVLCFVRSQGAHVPAGYGRYVERRLRRTLANGPRTQPPSYTELQAIKQKRGVVLAVTLMDGTVHTLAADSASTSAELCEALAHKVFVRDSFGFSLYIALFDKVSSLGAGADHVLDAVSQCEQYAREQGRREKDAPWRLFFRKEIFAPWPSDEIDVVASRLIYEQVVRGVKFGEYRLEQEDELAGLAAQQIFIDSETDGSGSGGKQVVDVRAVDKAVLAVVPDSMLEKSEDAATRWQHLVLHAYRKRFGSSTASSAVPSSADEVREHVVQFARTKWPLLFSRFYEAVRVAGRFATSSSSSPETKEVILAVSWSSLSVVDERERVLLHFSYPELAALQVHHHPSSSAPGGGGVRTPPRLSIRTVCGDEFVFESPNANDVCELVSFFLDGLKKRSRHLVAVSPQTATTTDTDDEMVECVVGDLLVLLDANASGHTLLSQPSAMVENSRTGRRGLVATEHVYVLPTLTRPSTQVMNLFARNESTAVVTEAGDCPRRLLLPPSSSSSFGIPATAQADSYGQPLQQSVIISAGRGAMDNASISGSTTVPPHTLQAYAAHHFRPAAGEPPSRRARQQQQQNMLWKHTSQPLTEPLLKKLEPYAEESAIALRSFASILQYTGEMAAVPSSRSRRLSSSAAAATAVAAAPNTIATDAIFAATLKYDLLKDELYCQLLKQLTFCPSPLVEHRLWELLWLATGLFTPSAALLKEVCAFVRTRPHCSLASDCLHRLARMSRSGGQRQHPPHQVEVEAVQRRTTHIYHKVLLPDSSEEAVHVESSARARDFAATLVSRLGLRSGRGFALFVRCGDKVLSVPDDDYFFDFVRRLSDWLEEQPQSNATSYQVYFMRKLWLDVRPGEDRAADLIFHFHQESPKYLLGFHRVTPEQATDLAALLLRARTRDDTEAPLSLLSEIQSELLPRDLWKARSQNEWSKSIGAAYSRICSSITSDDAKLSFLHYIADWMTFGSTFFEVRQSSDPALAEKLLLAVNQAGVHVYLPDTKQHIASYPWSSLSNWSSGSTYFHLSVGNATQRASRLMLETRQGYKMDDLVTAYMRNLLAAAQRSTAATATPRQGARGKMTVDEDESNAITFQPPPSSSSSASQLFPTTAVPIIARQLV